MPPPPPPPPPSLPKKALQYHTPFIAEEGSSISPLFTVEEGSSYHTPFIAEGSSISPPSLLKKAHQCIISPSQPKKLGSISTWNRTTTQTHLEQTDLPCICKLLLQSCIFLSQFLYNKCHQHVKGDATKSGLLECI